MLLSFLAGIMPSLLLIKAVYCLGKGMMLGRILETAIQFTKKFISARCTSPRSLLSSPLLDPSIVYFFSLL